MRDYEEISLPAGLTLSAAGVVSGTPGAAGAFSFSVTATDAHGFTVVTGYSLAIGVQAPVANAVTATVAANSSANAVTLSVTGGAATSVAVASAPSHGMATVTGTTISYTATNATGTSSPATVIVTVAAPTIAVSPAAGALPAGTVGTAYNQTFAASNGTAPYSYAVTSGSLPAGLTLSTAGVLSGTPGADGAFSFDVTATDAYDATGTVSYSLAIGVQAPIANAVAATVAANSSANPVMLAITGGAATSIAVSSAPSHGTATASGATISYTPTEGYSGTDSFTYTATNATSTSSPATVTVTIAAPTIALSPAAGALPAGTVGKAYGRVITASNGTAPYSHAVTAGSLPAGLTLNGATGKIGGTPTAAGRFNFTVTATDAYGATGSAVYSLAVKAPAVAFAFTPSAGSLGKAMAGEAYSQQIKATGGTTPLLYSLASGRLPKGMVLNVSTGELTGPLDAASAGNYAFRIAVRDSNGATGSAAYSLTVTRRQVTVQNIVVNVPAGGSPPDVYLNRGATGGAFTSAEATFVEPAKAGKAKIIRGRIAQAGPAGEPVGWYLQFTPNSAFSGAARVGYRLTSALGPSGIGTVTYNLHHDAQQVAEDRMTDPSDADAELTGNGWLAGPYASVEIGKGVFWDTSLLYGGSANDIDTTPKLGATTGHAGLDG